VGPEDALERPRKHDIVIAGDNRYYGGHLFRALFERVKEELRKGRGLKTAIEVGFEKAWPSVRDSNVATLITCALLFLIGTSIVRGFAVTLSMGVLISMFTGIVVSRWLSRWVAGTKIASNPKLFPGMTTTRQE
jgi:preprotein translocase subunit SecD